MAEWFRCSSVKTHKEIVDSAPAIALIVLLSIIFFFKSEKRGQKEKESLKEGERAQEEEERERAVPSLFFRETERERAQEEARESCSIGTISQTKTKSRLYTDIPC